MIDKVYLVIGHDYGYRNCGDCVSLYGVYADKEEAKERELELIKDGIVDGETFDVLEVEFNQNIDLCLGGCAE